MSVDNPLKWLLKELPAYLPRAHHALLMERYEMNKRAYYHAVKVRDMERKIRVYTRRNDPRDTITIAHWQAKLDKLKEESA